MREYHRHSKRITRGARWHTLRMAVLERDGWACVQCGARGRLEIDHIKPVRAAPELAYDPANCQALCASCHAGKTRIEVGNPPPSYDRQGWRKAVNELMAEHKKPSSNGE